MGSKFIYMLHRFGPRCFTPCIQRNGSTTDASEPAYAMSGKLEAVGNTSANGMRMIGTSMKSNAAIAWKYVDCHDGRPTCQRLNKTL